MYRTWLYVPFIFIAIFEAFNQTNFIKLTHLNIQFKNLLNIYIKLTNDQMEVIRELKFWNLKSKI